MNCKINRNAAKVLKKILEQDEAKGMMIRVFVSELHGGHAHYSLTLDTPNEYDEIVKTDRDIDILMDSRDEWLDGVWIQYYYVPEEGFTITNSSKGLPNH
ncbi:iron-sulfur cluster assembly accessory protein [Bacillaceae bacterium S4-13-56]